MELQSGIGQSAPLQEAWDKLISLAWSHVWPGFGGVRSGAASGVYLSTLQKTRSDWEAGLAIGF